MLTPNDTQFHLFLQQWARCCCSGILWGEASCSAEATAMGAWKLAEQRYLCPCQECKISSLPTSAGDNHPGTSRVRPRISVVWNLYDVFLTHCQNLLQTEAVCKLYYRNFDRIIIFMSVLMASQFNFALLCIPEMVNVVFDIQRYHVPQWGFYILFFC